MPAAASFSASTVSTVTADTVQFESAKNFGAKIYSARFYGRKSGRSGFAPIALFSGIGLLVAFVAVVSGVSGVWY
jgi:hypothetical protein